MPTYKCTYRWANHLQDHTHLMMIDADDDQSAWWVLLEQIDDDGWSIAYDSITCEPVTPTSAKILHLPQHTHS